LSFVWGGWEEDHAVVSVNHWQFSPQKLYTFVLMFYCMFRSYILNISGRKNEGKGKGELITGHEEPEGEQMYNYSLKLGATRGWVVNATPRLDPGKDPVPIV
jgi:hypothetical protein